MMAMLLVISFSLARMASFSSTQSSDLNKLAGAQSGRIITKLEDGARRRMSRVMQTSSSEPGLALKLHV